jgi:glycosyltransferase involved in cell wall biosynthesis
MMGGISVSVVIPCFNEAQVIQETYRRVASVCQNGVDGGFEILFVDDGSQDETWEIIAEMSHRDRNVVAVRLARNFGHQIALSAGFDLCRGEKVLVIDADLQDPPELLPEMLRVMTGAARGRAKVFSRQPRHRYSTGF